MAEPLSARERASRAARNASSGFRRRLTVFLSADAIRIIRAGGVAWVVGAIGFLAGIFLILTEFLAIHYVTTITASCDEYADSQLRDNCLVIGHESHAWALALLGLFVIVMSYGVAAGGSRPAAIALLAAGVVGLGITLIHDLPDTSKTGQVGRQFAEAKAHRGTGFWLEGIGSVLAIACGAFAVWRTPPPRSLRELRRMPPPSAGDADEPRPAPASEGGSSVQVDRVRVTGHSASHDGMGLALARMRGGSGVVAQSTLDGEEPQGTFTGSIKVMAAVAHGKPETLLEGTGTCTLSNVRVFGVVDELDASGDGRAVVFSVESGVLDEVESNRGGRRNRGGSVAMTGDAGAVVVEAAAVMEPDGSFREAGDEEFDAAARAFVARSEAPAKA